jgi:GGDEF domain-containing protein
MSSVKTALAGPPAALDGEQDGPGSCIGRGEEGPSGDLRLGSTNLYSWRQFHDRLREAAIQSAMITAPLALLMVEVRDLEKGGDALCRSLLQLFVQHVGACAVARYGQNTLIAILPHTQLRDAAAVADSFRLAARALGESHGTESVDVISAAVSGYDPDEPLGQLLERAFEQLRAAGRALGRETPPDDGTDASLPSAVMTGAGSGSYPPDEDNR